ncbi:MAG: DUF697 domain-containing protein [Anaerolineae bacterium]
MKRESLHLGMAAGLLLLVLFVLFVVNQTAQAVQLASAVHPALGRATLWGLLALYALALAGLVGGLVRMPSALRPPADEGSPEYEQYLRHLKARLEHNPSLAGFPLDLSTREGLAQALRILDEEAKRIIKETATTVFVSTAISQSGRLDGLMVLLAQARMVWRLAHLYHQRPSLREILDLYANVALTTLLVTGLEDMDIAEQVEPTIAAALSGSLASVVPGVNVVATMVTNSIIEGTANAFLVLRVGVVTRRYCGALERLDRKSLRRFASVEAGSLLGAIVLESAGAVTRAIANGARKAGLGTWEAVVGSVAQAGRVASAFGGRRGAEGAGPEAEGFAVEL